MLFDKLGDVSHCVSMDVSDDKLTAHNVDKHVDVENFSELKITEVLFTFAKKPWKRHWWVEKSADLAMFPTFLSFV